ncbi:MAG: 2-dehydropantoate 2-reductase [Gemmatimonadota bacterium]|nr:2-dehydropantoate 2-reductase [Gemmatimonadota bacterium]
MRIGVVGAGGAGGYFAGRWSEAGLDVAVVARGAHLEAIRRDGLHVRSPFGDVTTRLAASDDPAALASADFVMFATKTWQLEEAAAASGPHLAPTALVCGVQNGVDTIETLSRHVGPRRVLGATCRIISFVEQPGVIRHIGAAPTVLIGEPGGGVSERVREIAETLTLGPPATVTASPDITAELWTKMIFFTPLAGVGSVMRAPIGTVRNDPEGRRMLEAGMAEVASVAAALGVEIEDDAIERTIAFIDGLPPDGTSSLQRDIEAGRPNELDALSGAVSRLGADLGIPTPTHDGIVHELTARADPTDR